MDLLDLKEHLQNKIGKTIIHMALPQFEEYDCDLGMGSMTCKNVQNLRLAIEATVEECFRGLYEETKLPTEDERNHAE